MNPTLQGTIDRAWEARASLDPSRDPELRDAVEAVIAALDAGELRVAEKKGVGEWTVNQWVKKAVLLSFRLSENRFIQSGELAFYDKVEPKFSAASASCRRRSRGADRSSVGTSS
jgi:2,3,4,5-tetrahydropyridine-2-carboxylate N-succinyltransferase